MKKFKTKKNHYKFKIVFFLVIVFLSFSFFLSYFSKKLPNSKVLSFLIETNHLAKEQKKSTNNLIIDFLLDNTIGREYVEDEMYDGKKSENEYTIDPNPSENKKNPIIYIYNTHQGEEYKANYLSEVDISPTVMMASYYLREKLNELNLYSIVETSRISELLRVHGWDYSSSYLASKMLLTSAKEKNPALEYYFDIHRDSIERNISTLEYQNKSYAKVLFVVGIDYEGYENNLEFAKKVSDEVNKVIPDISRGILKKGGKGVNGIYNQDFASHMLLIELGGEYNTLSEVTNTIDILSSVLGGVIKNE